MRINQAEASRRATFVASAAAPFIIGMNNDSFPVITYKSNTCRIIWRKSLLISTGWRHEPGGETFASGSSSRSPASIPPRLVPIKSQTKIQTIRTWSPEEESLLDIPFKLHAIFNSGSVQFGSLVPPQGHQVLHTCAVAVSPFL